MKKKLFLIFFMILTAALFSDNIKVIPDLQITAECTAIASSKNQKILFAADSQGMISVWNPEFKIMIRSFPVGRLNIAKIVPHPVKNEIALIETDNVNIIKISVWNWITGTFKYSRIIESIPLDIQYSPKGTYLVYTISDWNSMHFLSADTGKEKTIIKNINGIIPAFYITPSEKTLVIYNLIGTIEYWNLQTGKLKTDYETKKNLKNVTFQFETDTKYIVASENQYLNIIDPGKGTAITRIKASGLSDIKVVEHFIIASKDNQLFIWEFNTATKKLTRSEYDKALFSGDINEFIYSKQYVYTATEDGLYYTSIYSENHNQMGTLKLQEFTSFAVNEDTIILTSPESTVSITHPFVSGSYSLETLPEIKSHQTPDLVNPDILHYQNGSFFVYNTKEKNGRFAFFSPSTGFTDINDSLSVPFLSVKKNNNQLLTLSANGTIQIFEPETGFTALNISSFGIHDVEIGIGNGILTARTKTSQYNYALVSINMKTEETTPLKTGNLSITHLSLDSKSNYLYSLGYEYNNDNLHTVVKNHGKSGKGPETVLDSVYGNYESAVICFDEGSSRLFTSISNSVITAFSKNSSCEYKLSNGIPKKIAVNKNLLIVLNQNNSISFWNLKTKKYIGTFYLFENNRWAFISAEGLYAFSGLSDLNFHGFMGASILPVKIDKKRIYPEYSDDKLSNLVY